jgi:hypothetical protein
MSIRYLFLSVVLGCAAMVQAQVSPQRHYVIGDPFNYYAQLSDWWAEGGKKVDQHRWGMQIDCDAPTPAEGSSVSVFNRRPLPAGDLVVDYTIQAMDDTGVPARNFNLLLNTDMPDGASLYQTRELRTDGDYKKYHQLNGYIFTFVNDNTNDYKTGRIRIRRCPGFELLAERQTDVIEAKKRYHIIIRKIGNTLSMEVNGKLMLKTVDEKGVWQGGYVGLRSWRSNLICMNFSVYQPGDKAPLLQQVSPHITILQAGLAHPEPTPATDVQLNPPTFRWPRFTDGPWRVEVSRDASFSQPQIVGTTADTFLRPSEPMDTGTWYWRVCNDKGDAWCPQPFTIPQTAYAWPVPATDVLLSHIPKAHPRLFIRPEDLPRLKAYALGDGKSVYDAILGNVEKSHVLTRKIPTEQEYKDLAKPDAQGKIVPYRRAAMYLAQQIVDQMDKVCLLYQITGDQAYADNIKMRTLRALELDPDGYTSNNSSDFGNADIVAAMGFAYDTIYDQFTEPQRQAIRDCIIKRIYNFRGQAHPFPEQNVFMAHGWQYIMLNMATGALAIYDESPQAKAYFDWSLRILIANYPWFGGNDGASAEGTKYHRAIHAQTTVRYHQFYYSATGLNLTENPWFRNNLTYDMDAYGTGITHTQFGDNWLEPTPTSRWLKTATCYWASWFKDPVIEKYYQAIPGKMSTGAGILGVLWLGSQQAIPVLPAHFPLQTPPGANLYRTNGLVFLHAQPDDEARDIFFEFRSSPYGSLGHAHADQNTFNVTAYGKQLMTDTGYYYSYGDKHHYGWTVATQAHNSLLMDGKGQPNLKIHAYGQIQSFKREADRVSWIGEAATAYPDVAVKKFNRHVLWLKPDTYVVADDVLTQIPHTFQWLLHCPNKMQVEGNTILLSNDPAQAKVQLFNSQSLDISQTDQYAVPVTQFRNDIDSFKPQNQWHLTAGTTSRSTTFQQVAVIQVHRTGVTLPEVQVQQSGNGVSIKLSDGRQGSINW